MLGVKRDEKRPTSNAPNNESKESLKVAVQRVSKLLDKEQSHTELVLKIFVKMNIKSNHDLYITLNNTRDSPQQAGSFVKRFKEASGGLHLQHKEGSFFRCLSMYMDGRWEYDHE